MQLNIFKGSSITAWERAPKAELFSPGWLGLKSRNWLSKLSWDQFEKPSKRSDMQLGVADGHIILKVIFSIAQ